MPTSDVMAKSGRMCLVRTVERPGIAMLHTCVDRTLSPSGRLIVNGFDAVHLLTTSMLSIMNMNIALVSVIACVAAIVIAIKASCEVGSNNARAAVAHACGHSM